MNDQEKTTPTPPATDVSRPTKLSDPAPLKPDGTPKAPATSAGDAGAGKHGRPTDDSDPGHS